MSGMLLRPAVQDDLEILWDFLAMATYEPDAVTAKAIAMVAVYLDDWQRPGDFGIIAERDNTPIGAIWAREFPPSDDKRFYHAERTPEMSIAVKPDVRGQGVGRMLVAALIAEARHRGLGLCLNVRNTNPARRLYERMGFEAVPGMTVTNRVGGLSIWMVLGERP
jgi:GNAT superfamily N-acetyltransferase